MTNDTAGSRKGIINSLLRLVKLQPGVTSVEIISHAVWLYFRLCLSYRDVEELLFARVVLVSYKTIRQWCRKFGQEYANQLRRRRPRPGDKWPMDEVFLTIKVNTIISGGPCLLREVL